MSRKKTVLMKLSVCISIFLLPYSISSCIRSNQSNDAMTESEIIQLQSNCGNTRTFLFAHTQTTLKGQTQKDWSCWYAAKSQRVYGQPTDEEMKKMFTESKPIVLKYINSNTLTRRLTEIDQQRTAVMWLGSSLALLGCGVLALGSGGLALSACAILGSAAAAYDVMGGDPSMGASEAWRKMADMSDKEIMKTECNAIGTIIEQARLIDRRVLPKAEGSSSISCPSTKSFLNEKLKIAGVQAGPEEIKRMKEQNAAKK